MLHEFLTVHREELIQRCRAKVSRRSSPPVTATELEHGVPLFLEQLVAVLRCETDLPSKRRAAPADGKSLAATEGRRTAALHGRELLAKGYTVDQVVHGYGDVCQSITELAKERTAPVTVDEFHTLNRLLDSAIADAVSAFGEQRDDAVRIQGNHDLHERMGTLADEHRKLIGIALKALDALKVGNIGVMGATGTVLEDSLRKMQDLVDRALPEMRLATGMTTTPQKPV